MSIPKTAPYLTNASEQKHSLTAKTITLGREVDNIIVIVSKRASRQHASIR